MITSGWRRIRREMIAFCEHLQQIKRDYEHQIVYNERKHVAALVLRRYKNDLNRLPPTTWYPSVAEFCAFQLVHDVLDLPNEIQVTPAYFHPVERLMPSLCAAWRLRVLNRVSSIATGVDQAAAVHNLACKVLLCSNCSSYPDDLSNKSQRKFRNCAIRGFLLWWPQAVTHACTRIKHMDSEPPDDAMVLSLESARRGGARHARIRWESNADLLKHEPIVEAIARKIVTAMGLDPDTATEEMVDRQANLTFICSKCDRGKRERVLWNWRAVVSLRFLMCGRLLTISLSRFNTSLRIISSNTRN